MHPMSDSPTKKTLKQATAEFVKTKEGLDKSTLIDYIEEVLEPRAKMTLTAHLDDDGEIDCVCLGDLCDIHYVPTEEAIGCKRLSWLFLEENKKEKRKRREDYVEV